MTSIQLRLISDKVLPFAQPHARVGCCILKTVIFIFSSAFVIAKKLVSPEFKTSFV